MTEHLVFRVFEGVLVWHLYFAKKDHERQQYPQAFAPLLR